MKKTLGFSLLEMVVVTGLMALLVLLGLNLLRSSAASSTKSEMISQKNEQLRSAQSLIRRHLTSALTIPYEFNASNGESTLFDGQRDKVQFVANMPGYMSYGGAYLQTLELKREGDSYRLEFQFQQLTPEGVLKPERPPEVLLEGIKSGEFSYRSLDQNSQPGDWKNTWDVVSQLPLHVRIQFEMKDAKNPWPEMLIAPKLAIASANSGSTFNPVERGEVILPPQDR
jgi:general secretion pathway protein J